ncbi:MAG: hypothetical protein QOH79_3847 [Acidimicrobiaceae bacterium]
MVGGRAETLHELFRSIALRPIATNSGNVSEGPFPVLVVGPSFPATHSP